MANDPLRAAVIGGRLGAAHAYAYARSHRYQLVAICDLNPAIFPYSYKRAEIEPGSVVEYTDYHLMLARENLDVVSVATPDHLHADATCATSEAGVKGIFCEKPLATTLEDGRPHDRHRRAQRHPHVSRPHPQLDAALPGTCSGPCAMAPWAL